MLRSWDVARDLPPFDVRPLLPRERARLIQLLATVEASGWTRPTACPGWSVHDLVLHLIGDDLGCLGRQADSEARAGKLDFLVLAELIERSNEEWVRVARRIPPSLAVEMLALTGPRVDAAFTRLDMESQGTAVAWTGSGPSPNWLDIAREYTERWVHHQQIRLALGRPVLSGRTWLHPVLAAFVRSLPLAYDTIPAAVGTCVALTVEGPAGGRWLLRRREDRWHLVADDGTTVASEVRLDQDLAWRLFTRLVSVEVAQPLISISGDRNLGLPATRAVAVMTTKL